MSEAVTAKQLIEQLSAYDLSRITFQMPDGLPVTALYVDTNERGQTVITLSDQDVELTRV
jgi:hypothetical protein